MLRKCIGFAGPQTVVEQNRTLGFWFELAAVNEVKIRSDAGHLATLRIVCDMPIILPSDLALFVDGVVPELRWRGLVRPDYAPGTSRDRLGLPHPVNRFAPGCRPRVRTRTAPR